MCLLNSEVFGLLFCGKFCVPVVSPFWFCEMQSLLGRVGGVAEGFDQRRRCIWKLCVPPRSSMQIPEKSCSSSAGAQPGDATFSLRAKILKLISKKPDEFKLSVPGAPGAGGELGPPGSVKGAEPAKDVEVGGARKATLLLVPLPHCNLSRKFQFG